MLVHGYSVYGIDVDERTGCAHYRSALDIIAIRFKCCQRYYPCHHCHDVVADHPIKRWNSNEFYNEAVLCGHCGQQLTIQQYLTCNNQCPNCQANFNPGCRLHHDHYFSE